MEPKKYSILESFFVKDSIRALNELSPEERLFVYYMRNAAVCGHPLALIQLSPFPGVLDKIYNMIKYIETASPFQSPRSGESYIEKEIGKEEDVEKKKEEFLNSNLLSDLKTYWIYLFSNYGVHFYREFLNNKKIPSDLNLNFDRETLEKLCQTIPEELRWKCVFDEDEYLYVFDKKYFPTLKVKENIEKSGSQFYGKYVTTELFNSQIPPKIRTLNSYYDIQSMGFPRKIIQIPYKIGGYGEHYLKNCFQWIDKAYNVAFENPEYFDGATVKSLSYLLKFLISGKEKDFKDHSREWAKMNNRVEYNFGFIEYYQDPMGRIGTFQADVTVKTRNFQSLLEKLPTFEERFPLPRQWKRKNMDILPNAAEAHKVIGTGGLGPVLFVLAYCLPNYEDIRSETGSKQIIYSSSPITDVNKYMQIYFSKEDQELFRKVSPDLKLKEIVRSLTVTLHETIGHASGAPWYLDDGTDDLYHRMNTDIDGKYESMENKTLEYNSLEYESSKYQTLDKYNCPKVTSTMRNDMLGEYGNALEEMRAEIIALYVGMKFFSEIYITDFLGSWPDVSYEKICKFMIYDIAGSGYLRWRGCCEENSTRVTGAHAIADTAIMYYLIDHSEGAIKLVKEDVEIDGEIMPTLKLNIDENRMQDILHLVEGLTVKIQRFASTLPVKEIREFMETYGTSTRDLEYAGIVKNMKNVCNSGVKAYIQAFPEWEIKTEGTEIIDAIPKVPKDVFSNYKQMYELAYDNPKL